MCKAVNMLGGVFGNQLYIVAIEWDTIYATRAPARGGREGVYTDCEFRLENTFVLEYFLIATNAIFFLFCFRDQFAISKTILKQNAIFTKGNIGFIAIV